MIKQSRVERPGFFDLMADTLMVHTCSRASYLVGQGFAGLYDRFVPLLNSAFSHFPSHVLIPNKHLMPQLLSQCLLLEN